MIYRDPVPLLLIDTRTGLLSRYIRPAAKLLHETCKAQLLGYDPYKPVNLDELERFRAEG